MAAGSSTGSLIGSSTAAPTVSPAKAFLGVGWSFPPCAAGDGSTLVVSYEQDVYQAIWIILSTDWGERVMRPTFGAGLKSFVFAPMSQIMMQQVQTRVQQSLVMWEPRITVEEVDVSIDPNNQGTLLIAITYLVNVTNTLQNLVYPFFLQEGAD
ncbi:MAG TPA: GPW/gp25 family protein [Terriglobales bacterium]|jgi:phage baseplate assembly protein W|nr:GPW/gp25 family protein [Terriglobales bacterium]